MKLSRAVAAALAFGFLLASVTVVVDEAPARAANASQFDPGNIISDAYFYDGAAMSGGEVQSFLNSVGVPCAAGFVCIKDYHQATRGIAAVPGRCAAYVGGPSESAAAIITKVGQACNISQKVLLVTLQKEMSLITHPSPSADRYRVAMGYGCPDTAPCNSEYYGFQNQVYRAALQFQVYLNNPTLFNHGPHRVNTIRFDPNPACGSSQVYIQNNATAALYNYTPYQPNAAALANLYGTGDGCSSYGNRNFWRLYTDWFGPTTASSLVKTASSPTVYITSGDLKYPLPSEDFLSIYAPLGPISVVSQGYLNSYTTAQPAGRVIRNTTGSIFFTDASYRIPFSTCEQVINYGGSCLSSGYVQLTNNQVALFYQPSGLVMTNVLGTNTGARYFIQDAQKREILDTQSQTEAGIPLGHAVLTDRAVAGFATAAPVARQSIVVSTRSTNAYSFLAEAVRFDLTTAEATNAGLMSRVAGTLNADSVAKIPVALKKFSGVVSVGGGPRSLLTNSGKYAIDGTTPLGSVQSVDVLPALLDTYPALGSLAAGTFVSASNSGTVYRLGAVDMRALSSWSALASLAGPQGISILTVSAAAIAGIEKGPSLLASGTLYRTPENAGVYLINGMTSRIPLSSFEISGASGFTKFEYTTQGLLNGYPVADAPFSFGIDCGGTKFVGVGGEAKKIPAGSESLYPLSFIALDSVACASLVKGVDAIPFIGGGNGAIYQLIGGEKRPFSTYEKFAEANGGQGWMQVSNGLLGLFPTGAAL